MILSNIEIHRALDAKEIIITPEPLPRFASLDEGSSPYGTTAVDLRLSSELSIPIEDEPFTFDLRKGGFAPFMARNSKSVTIPESGYTLERNTFILGRTEEKVQLPIKEGRSIAARVEGKSSRARCGLLVHFTAPTVHAGFEGTITLEIINLGPCPITLFPGVPICQLIFERVDGTPRAAPSQFQGQSSPVGVIA